MTAEKNDRVPPSTQVSPFDLLLSACAVDGHQNGRTQRPERRRRERRGTQASVSSDTVRLAVGQLLGGRYRIERELGEGGMGVVYLVADEQVPGERFAIKVLKEELRPEALTLLREEDRKTRKLSHPNLNVIGRTSSFHFRDSKEDGRSIGAKLGVAHVLEGGVCVGQAIWCG